MGEAEILVDPTLNMRLTNGPFVLEEKVWVNDVIKSEVSGLYPVQAFAHYIGENTESIKQRFKRVHECLCFEKSF